MFIRKTTTVFSLMLVFTLIVGSTAFAQQHLFKGLKKAGLHEKFIFEHMSKELNLSEDQQVALKELKENQKADMQEVRQLMAETMGLIMQELAQYDSDPSVLNELVQEMEEDISHMIALRLTGVTTAKSILTPEQWSEFVSIAEERREKALTRLDHMRGMLQNFELR